MQPDKDTNSIWLVADDSDVSFTFSSLLAVKDCFVQMESRATGDLTLWEEIRQPKERSLWRRFFEYLGGPPQTHRVHLELAWNAGVAAVIFLNSNGQEHRVLAETPIPVSDETRSKLTFGELTPLDSQYCLPKSRAFQIVRQYLEAQTLPAGIKYEIVG